MKYQPNIQTILAAFPPDFTIFAGTKDALDSWADLRNLLGYDKPNKGSAGAATSINLPLPVKVAYCLYARKSTESEEQQVLSIDSQIKEIIKIAERDNLEITEIRKESHSSYAAGRLRRHLRYIHIHN